MNDVNDPIDEDSLLDEAAELIHRFRLTTWYGSKTDKRIGEWLRAYESLRAHSRETKHETPVESEA